MMLFIRICVIPVQFIVNNIFTRMCGFEPLKRHRSLTHFNRTQILRLWGNTLLCLDLNWATQWTTTLRGDRLYLYCINFMRCWEKERQNFFFSHIEQCTINFLLNSEIVVSSLLSTTWDSQDASGCAGSVV